MKKSGPQPTQQFRGKLTHTSLLLILPLALIPVAILGIITLVSTNNFLREQVTTQFISVGDKQEELIDNNVQTRESFLQLIAKDSTFRFSFDKLFESAPGSADYQNARNGILTNYERLSRTQAETLFNYFMVVSPEKEILVSTYPLWEGKILDQKAYDALLSTSGSVGLFNVSPFHTEEFDDRFLVFSSQQVFEDSEQPTGTLIGITGPNTFQQILELGKLSYAEARSYYISNPFEEGLFIGLSPTTGELAQFTPSADHIASVMPKIMNLSADKEGVLEFVSFNNENVLAVVKWLPSIQGALVLEVPQSTITKPLQTSAVLEITLLLIALVVLGLIIWQGTQRIVKPILQISETARHFADGDMTERAPVNRNDEIGLLAASFNQVADQLVGLYRSLEAQVEARTQQIRMAGEVAQISTSATTLDEMLKRTVQLIVERFGYYHAAVYLLDRGGDEATLRQAAGQSAEELMAQGLHVAVGSRSIVGNVSATNKAWVVSDVKQDPYYLEIDSLAETQSEVAVPLNIGELVLGVLDVQSDELKVFDEEEVTTLQTLARQIASAIQNVRLLETTQVDLQSTNLLFQVSHRLAEANTKNQVFEILSEVLRQVPLITATFVLEAHTLQSLGISTALAMPLNRAFSIQLTPMDIENLTSTLSWKIMRTQYPPEGLLDDFLALANEIGCQAFVLVPLLSETTFRGLILLGSSNQASLAPSVLEPYHSIAELTSTALEKIEATEEITQRFAELQSLNLMSQAISTETELKSLFEILHRQINQAMGETNFLIALYNAKTELVEIPYMAEGQQTVSIPSFPLGQGLTSIVIRTQQPLMIVEDTISRSRALGAIVTSDHPARSWLGVPMIVGGEVVGAVVVQDTDREYRFDDDDLRLLTTLAGQVAPTIRNARLLSEAQETAERDRRLYEVTDKIRQATSIQSILEITTQELSKILNLKTAKIEISVDPTTLSKRDNGSEEKPE
jgi:GAF domain-containing protein/HAMP domain-containing protein